MRRAPVVGAGDRLMCKCDSVTSDRLVSDVPNTVPSERVQPRLGRASGGRWSVVLKDTEGLIERREHRRLEERGKHWAALGNKPRHHQVANPPERDGETEGESQSQCVAWTRARAAG